jgi:polysaccharide deacetylase family protein (PEP-CTERM system associated)
MSAPGQAVGKGSGAIVARRAHGADGLRATGFLADTRMWQRPAGQELVNALTCDVEDYFQVGAFEQLVPQSRWSDFECRIPRNVDRALELYAAAGVKGTFFTLGWVAERYPEVVRRIAGEGHEIASHGMRHVRVFTQQPEEFRADAGAAKKLLEDVSGQPVRGYRAASWSMDARTPWAHRILRECGYEYSSSLFPIAHDHYGVPDAPAAPFYIDSADILEIPATTAHLFGRNLPAAGGGFFRLLPLPVSFWLMRRAQQQNGVPVVFYFHPWELDPEQPRMAGASARARFRHYLNLDKFGGRLASLLQTFRWQRMDVAFGIGGAKGPGA